MNYRIVGLPASEFTHLFGLSDGDLAAIGGVRRVADGNYPCRVSLTDSQPGQELLLINYEHHAVRLTGCGSRSLYAKVMKRTTRQMKSPSSFASACSQ
jgi:hypothetical protein